MFYHKKRLQYFTKPEKPDPVYAKQLQELIGGPFGEMSVMMQYLFQGWNCRGPAKYKDMMLDIGTEEIGHVEMLANMIAHLVDKAPADVQEKSALDPIVEGVMGGMKTEDIIMSSMNPKHAIVAGGGALPADSTGYPWNGNYIVASGNLMADFYSNVQAEAQGRLQAVRLYEMSTDPGVKDTLSYMIARDTMHQNQWLAAIEELKADGLEDVPVPSRFSRSQEKQDVSYQFWNLSEGTESEQGRWAKGPSPDGKGEFEYLENPEPQGPEGEAPIPNPKLYSTPKK
ncbi:MULTISPECIES: manganese catalase family protein [unclassified Nodosilinea]|uniref:Manganese catalase family protein n=2 Tax=Leptolyngbya TaxID=47251 RepID=A0ABV0K5I4_9CYAN|nr:MULTISPECIES: manganese catalase family protein [unclassified Nodosilinea]MBD2107658.1 manganese catalase family protein [Nodosilinea sp. FACHB-13]MBD2114356.1 manganese catalase family protein [Nodosilinea sp. FACHB-141]